METDRLILRPWQDCDAETFSSMRHTLTWDLVQYGHRIAVLRRA